MQNNWNGKGKMTVVNPYIIFSLNVNGWNSPIKMHRVAG